MTKLIARTAIACAVAVAMLASSTMSLGAEPKYKYEGTWEGTLSRGSFPKEGTELTWEKNFQVRLTFAKGNVSVHAGRNNEWREVRPGKFQLETLDTNAVILSIASGRDRDGIWVETWTFAVTPIDSTHLHVLRQRQVKNKDMDVSNPDAVWVSLRMAS